MVGVPFLVFVLPCGCFVCLLDRICLWFYSLFFFLLVIGISVVFCFLVGLLSIWSLFLVRNFFGRLPCTFRLPSFLSSAFFVGFPYLCICGGILFYVCTSRCCVLVFGFLVFVAFSCLLFVCWLIVLCIGGISFGIGFFFLLHDSWCIRHSMFCCSLCRLQLLIRSLGRIHMVWSM